MILIPGYEDELRWEPLGYDLAAVQKIKEADLSLVLRLPNSEDQNDNLLDQAENVADEQTNRILFLGTEVSGWSPNTSKVKAYADELKAMGMGAYTIEFTDQKGFHSLAYQMDMDVIRLHSLNLNQFASSEEGVERAVRAVKERNIRSLFITMENKRDVSPKKTLEKTEAFIEKFQKDMPGLFHLGKAYLLKTFMYQHGVISLLYWLRFYSFPLQSYKLLKKMVVLFISNWLGLISIAYLVLPKMIIHSRTCPSCSHYHASSCDYS